jgi:hypothetical protein
MKNKISWVCSPVWESLKTFYDTKGKCYGSAADYLKINEKQKYPGFAPQSGKTKNFL